MRHAWVGFIGVLSTAPVAAQAPIDRFFSSNGVQIRYVEQGTGDPVLLVHGYTRSIETNWIETGVLPDLAKDHHVVAFDLRGHGKSGKPYAPDAYGAEMARDAIRLLDHLKIPRVHVIGYSLGGAITFKLLTTDRGRFVSAVIGGSAGYRNWEPRFDESGKRNAAELETDVPFRGLVVAMTPPDEPPRTEEQIVAMSKALAAVNDVKALGAYQRKGLREINMTDAGMAAIKTPVLGIAGSLDPALRSMQAVPAILPSFRIAVIDGATHMGDRGAVRRPEFISTIRAFIDAHPMR